MLIPVLFHLYFFNRMASGETSEWDLIPPLFFFSSKRHLAGRFKSVIDKDDFSYFARVALPASSHRLGCPNLVIWLIFLPYLCLFLIWLSATDSAYSCLVPCLLLPYFWTLAFCSIFCLFLPYSWFIPAYIIPALFLPYFWILAFCSIFCLFLPYSWLIPALFLAYSCLISALFLDFGFLQHILLIPALFLAYSCLIPALFLLILDLSFLQHILLIPALFLAYSCLIPCLFLPCFCSFFYFGSLQHILLIPALFLAYSWYLNGGIWDDFGAAPY